MYEMQKTFVGKRVYLVNPCGYPSYSGTIRGWWPPFRGSGIYNEWADVDWDIKVHPCTTPIEVRHLRLIEQDSPLPGVAQNLAIVDVAWRRVEFIGSRDECDNYTKSHPERFMQTGSRNFITVLMP